MSGNLPVAAACPYWHHLQQQPAAEATDPEFQDRLNSESDELTAVVLLRLDGSRGLRAGFRNYLIVVSGSGLHRGGRVACQSGYYPSPPALDVILPPT
jgi:hypothetical protein